MEITSLESEQKRTTSEIKDLRELLEYANALLKYAYENPGRLTIHWAAQAESLISRIHKQLDETE